MIKKNFLVTLMVATIAGSMLMGCGASNTSNSDSSVTIEESAVPQEEAAPAEESTNVGSVITLEDYFNEPANKAANDTLLDTMLKSSGSTFSDIQFECNGNELIYTFVLAEGLELSAADLESQKDSQTATVDASKDQVEKAVGVRPEAIKYVYKNFDGSEITTLVY